MPSTNRSAKGAEGGRLGEGMSPVSIGGEVWGGGSAPPQKIFDILESKWRIFVDSVVLNFAFLYDQNSKKIHPECMKCHGD